MYGAKNNIFIYLIAASVITSLLLLSGCANPVAPTGGPKDTSKPKIDSLKSSPNGLLNYKGRGFELRFNEFILLDNIASQLVVSPPLEYPLEVKPKGKVIKIKFHEKEILKENTTYTIQFGEAIKDITEKNPASDLKIVFSTGDKLDNAKLTGSVRTAFNNEAVEGVIALLHSNTVDTSFRKNKPDYFARCSKEGTFTIDNIRPGQYIFYALKDENANYKFDIATELIGFKDSVIITEDTSLTIQTVLISKDDLPPSLIDKSLRNRGVMKFFFSGKAAEIKYKIQAEGVKYISQIDKDTLTIWYPKNIKSALKVELDNGIKKDTVVLDTTKFQSSKSVDRLLVRSLKKFGPTSLSVGQEWNIAFNNPIVSIDPSRIITSRDTSIYNTGTWMTDSLFPTKLHLSTLKQKPGNIKSVFLPGALVDFYGNKNDTLVVDAKINTVEQLGNFNLSITGMDLSEQYLIELTNASNETIDLTEITGVSIWKKLIPNLIPGVYQVTVITDSNKNGRWDSVKLKEKKQAETVFKKKSEPLKPNWQLDFNIIL